MIARIEILNMAFICAGGSCWQLTLDVLKA